MLRWGEGPRFRPATRIRYTVAVVDDAELRRRLKLLQDMLREGRLQFSKHLADGIEASLLAVRTGPDGEVDLSTVDSRVRSLAVMSAVVDHRDQAKAIASLKEVQTAYFALIEREFGNLYKQAQKKGHTVHTASLALSEDRAFVETLDPQIDSFLEEIREFWAALFETVDVHVQDLRGSKGIFGGELFPHWSRNVASTAGLYLDTIILQCPFLHTATMFQMWPADERVRYLFRHAFTLLSYKELALADVEPPIVAILPFRVSMEDDEERKFLSEIAKGDAIEHLERMTGIRFESLEAADEYLRGFSDVSSLLSNIPNKERLLFDTDWTEPLAEQFAKEAQVLKVKMDHIAPGSIIVGKAHGRMMQATDILMRSRLLGGTPLIMAETSWRYFQWKLEYSSDSETGSREDLHMVRGLHGLGGGDLRWLGAIPPAALIEMRTTGALAEIRQVLSRGISDVAEASGGSFHRTRDRIWDNIQSAFDVHQENIKELHRKQMKFVGQDLGSWFVSGAIEVAAVASGLTAFGLGAIAASQVLDAPKLKELPRRLRDLRNADKELRKSPMGLFFKHRR